MIRHMELNSLETMNVRKNRLCILVLLSLIIVNFEFDQKYQSIETIFN